MQTPRVAVVTGGSGGIGEAITRALHTDGWTVAIGYVSRGRAEALASALSPDGDTAIAVPLDMTDTDQIRSTILGLLERFGRLEGLVFNGGAAHGAYFVDSHEDDWWHEMQVNFLGPLLMTKLSLPAMVESRRGVIVGISSESAKLGDIGHAAYAASKAALNSFLKTLVREHGRDGIRGSCVAPGPIDTPMLRYTFGTDEEAEKAIAKMTKLVPIRRLGRPNEVAEAVRFLCSEGDFVAGEHISVGGGVSMNS
jgi:2-hydroxycyclohexanecarboxyl-CoA dehydrogenase